MDGGMRELTIGRVAKAAGIGVETVRFYEKRGLIARPKRPMNGFRSYDASAVERLAFIRQAKALGFSLNEVKTLLDLRMKMDDGCARSGALAAAKLAEFDAKIAALKAMRRSLAREIEICRASNGVDCGLRATRRG
jgi:MerR family transcriptional regulator, copper efflux regulator